MHAAIKWRGVRNRKVARARARTNAESLSAQKNFRRAKAEKSSFPICSPLICARLSPFSARWAKKTQAKKRYTSKKARQVGGDVRRPCERARANSLILFFWLRRHDERRAVPPQKGKKRHQPLFSVRRTARGFVRALTCSRQPKTATATVTTTTTTSGCEVYSSRARERALFGRLVARAHSRAFTKA